MHFFDFSALFYPRIVRNVSPELSEAPGVFFHGSSIPSKPIDETNLISFRGCNIQSQYE
jgi:hypothetical protein